MKKKRLKQIGIGLLVVAVAVGAFLYFYKEKEPVEYQTVEVEKRDLAKTVSATGHVEGKDTTYYSVKQTQLVEKIHVKEGDLVKKGDVLITFDLSKEESDYEKDIKEANLQEENARINKSTILAPASGNTILQHEDDIQSMEKNVLDAENELESIGVKISQQKKQVDDLEKTVEKNKSLYESDVITEREYDQSVLGLETAKDSLEDLEIQKKNKENMIGLRKEQLGTNHKKLDNAKNTSSDASVALEASLQDNIMEQARLEKERVSSEWEEFMPEIVAKTSGTIKTVDIEEGEKATGGIFLIEMEDVSELYVESDVSEYDAIHCEVGQAVEISTSGMPDAVFKGKVDKISSHAIKKETSSGDEVFVPIRVKIDSKEDKLRSGYTVDLDFITESKKDVLSIPIQAVVSDGDGAYVYIQMKDEEPKMRDIKLGFHGDRYVEVLDGLSLGDKIVLDITDIEETE